MYVVELIYVNKEDVSEVNIREIECTSVRECKIKYMKRVFRNVLVAALKDGRSVDDVWEEMNECSDTVCVITDKVIK